MRLRRAGVLLVATSLAASGCGIVGGGGGTYELTAYFPRAVSVFEESDVRVLGLPAGSVEEVAVEDDQVKVVLSVDDDIPVPADVTAQLVPQSLIGERYVELAPAFQHGMERAEDGMVIEDTITPTEPDEALAALKEFLDSLDPEGLGRLVTNLDEDLRGNGAPLNDTLAALTDLVSTFAEKDDALGRIVDSFDRLTRTLSTREQQLGEVLDAFAQASQVLADERQGIEDLVGGLADLSREGLSLVAEHDTQLRAGIQTLTDAAATIDANLESVDELLASAGLLAPGLIGAFDPSTRSMRLRNNFSPLVIDIVELLASILNLDLPSLCVAVLAECADAAGVQGTSGTAATVARFAPGSPVGALVDLLGAPSAAPRSGGPGPLERAGGFLRDAADTLLGAGS
jgi:phospholipid/cholesterol/gamma-HCH transport system substrate-binding protein